MRIYRIIFIIILFIVFVAINIFLFARFLRLGNEPVYAILFLAGINLNLIALLILIFYVGKNILRLFIDKKRNIPGHRFQIQLVSIFVFLTLIPGIFLFIIGSGLVTGYIEKWLNPEGLSSLENAIKLAKLYYEDKKAMLLRDAREIADALRKGKDISLEKQSSPTVRWYIMDNPMDDLTKEAYLKGESGKEEGISSEVTKTPEGEYIRVALLVTDTSAIHGGTDKKVGAGISKVILVGSVKVPPEVTDAVERLKRDYEEQSLKLKWKMPLKINFVLTFGFFTLLIIMLALWTGFRTSKKITGPIKDLTEATMEVASGNLEVKIKNEEERKDEISYLIQNFNIMIEQLKESKKRLQEAYAETETQRIRLSSILENIHTGVIFIDGSGTVVSMNRASERILSIDASELIGRSYRAILEHIFGRESREGTSINSDYREFENLIKGIKIKELKGIEREIRINVNNKPVILRVFITSLRMPQEIGLIVVFDDITDIVNAQRAMAWQEIASRIAHEVKNPLTPIQLSTERLIKKWQNKDSDFDEVFMRSTKAIIKEVESLKRLVADFSQFGRMPHIDKKIVDIREILKEVYYLYSGFKEITITIDMPSHAVFAEIDPEQLKRVFINIMDNAIEAINNSDQLRGLVEKATIGEGASINKGNIHIDLTVNKETETLTISIADNGPGIPDEIKDKLFMPHFTTKKGGTGLGLAIANRIVTEHRGVIRIKDNEPRGSIFLIELPVKG